MTLHSGWGPRSRPVRAFEVIPSSALAADQIGLGGPLGATDLVTAVVRPRAAAPGFR
jgi:hypothetical protein